MPYRRLPNTDQARLKALTMAVKEASEAKYGELAINYKTLNEASNFLTQFESKLSQYHQTVENRVNAAKQYRHIVSNARMYISHFIQVLNLAVIRGEIKKEQKEYYKLDTEIHNVPDLSTDAALLEWGENIINGEKERTQKGGLPIYNPRIANVQVHYDLFKEYQATQKIHQSTANRNWEELNALRETADNIILDIWNQVEEHYALCKPYEKLKKCEAYGLIYYYRKGEKELTPETDIAIQKLIDQSPSIFDVSDFE